MSVIIPGFQFAGVHCGIKDNPRKKDLTLIYSEEPLTLIEGVFTTNKVTAAPVEVCKKSIRKGKAQLIVINSGVANACTGAQGMKDALETQKYAAQLFQLDRSQVMVCSTGKIGDFLPMQKLKEGLIKAKDWLDPKSFLEAAKGIMTTDQFVKWGCTKGKLQGKKYTLAVMTKGAGMLRPDMATMLTFIVTDLNVDKATLKTIFRRTIDRTLNRVTVDGDTSTNDTVLMMANGRAGNVSFTADSPEGAQIEKQLMSLLTDMAKKITLDGEGATKCTKIIVNGAKNQSDAKKIAYSVGNSPLVKTALFGCDPNWGRIMAAVGYSGAKIKPEKINIAIGPYWVAKQGMNSGEYKAKDVSKYLKKKDVEIRIDCNVGNADFFVYASDLTYDYIHLNAEYHT